MTDVAEMLLPCRHCGETDIRHDHPTRAPRVYCSQCRSTAESPLIWNSRPEDWDAWGGIALANVRSRVRDYLKGQEHGD